MSINNVFDEEKFVKYLVEFLITLQFPSNPPHNLKVRVGLLVNAIVEFGSASTLWWTRRIVKTLKQNIPNLRHCSYWIFLKEIRLSFLELWSSPLTYHFTFKRLEFPLKEDCAMSINKAQGQTLQYAPTEIICSPTRQLCVACCRECQSANVCT